MIGNATGNATGRVPPPPQYAQNAVAVACGFLLWWACWFISRWVFARWSFTKDRWAGMTAEQRCVCSVS